VTGGRCCHSENQEFAGGLGVLFVTLHHRCLPSLYLVIVDLLGND